MKKAQKRQLREVSGCITNDVFERLETMRHKGLKDEVSRSRIVAGFVTQGVQQNGDAQYISMIEPAIEGIMTRILNGYMNRFMAVLTKDFYSTEEIKLLLEKAIPLAPEQLAAIRKEAHATI